MDMGLLFWIIMILCILSYIGAWSGWSGPWVYSNSIITLVLLGLLGWRVFGPILR
jgi:hypothetical protein